MKTLLLPLVLSSALFVLPAMANPSLKVGDAAPDFALPDQNGHTVKLSDFRGKKNVVLAFYLKANTSGWTRELQAYQADTAKFVEANTQVLGISIDSPAANQSFARKLGAAFPLLSDPGKTTVKAYDVLNFTRLFANRVTFVIDQEGVIRHIDKGSDTMDPMKAHAACSLLAHPKNPWIGTFPSGAVCYPAIEPNDVAHPPLFDGAGLGPPLLSTTQGAL